MVLEGGEEAVGKRRRRGKKPEGGREEADGYILVHLTPRPIVEQAQKARGALNSPREEGEF